MNTSVPADTLLPREELIKLLCTSDGKGEWAKMAQLSLLFKAIDDFGDNVAKLQETWEQVKLVQEEKSRLIVDLSHDRDAWRSVAKDYERRLDELGKL